MTTVEKRVHQLRSEIHKFVPIVAIAQDDIAGLMQRRAIAVKKLADHDLRHASKSTRPVRVGFKMSKAAYQTNVMSVKNYFEDKHKRKHAILKGDVAETWKGIVHVARYIKALTEKIDSLVDELGIEYNSEAWNTMTHDKRLQIDSDGLTAGGNTPEMKRGRAKAKSKNTKPDRGMQRFAGDETPPSPPISGMAAHTPPLSAYHGELVGFHQHEVKSFKGPWSVVCGQMKAEANVTADGLFDMHQTYTRGNVPGGWSCYRCKIIKNDVEKSFTTDIDGVAWRMVEAAIDPNAKSVIVWETTNPEMPQSVWTRTKRPEAAQAKSVKPKAKTQARRAPAGNSDNSRTGASNGGSATGGGSPTPSPVEWYTEIRDGRLMWTDGFSAVPAEDRVGDETNRQKTKMQF